MTTQTYIHCILKRVYLMVLFLSKKNLMVL